MADYYLYDVQCDHCSEWISSIQILDHLESHGKFRRRIEIDTVDLPPEFRDRYTAIRKQYEVELRTLQLGATLDSAKPPSVTIAASGPTSTRYTAELSSEDEDYFDPNDYLEESDEEITSTFRFPSRVTGGPYRPEGHPDDRAVPRGRLQSASSFLPKEREPTATDFSWKPLKDIYREPTVPATPRLPTEGLPERRQRQLARNRARAQRRRAQSRHLQIEKRREGLPQARDLRPATSMQRRIDIEDARSAVDVARVMSARNGSLIYRPPIALLALTAKCASLRPLARASPLRSP